MSRYYCKNCRAEYLIFGDDWIIPICCSCYKDNGGECNEELVELPDYETPEQYEKRTSRKWNGAVWSRCRCENIRCDSYRKEREVVNGKDIYHPNVCDKVEFICAQSPEPPPDDWKPEEGV